jgi:hypothetical protein
MVVLDFTLGVYHWDCPDTAPVQEHHAIKLAAMHNNEIKKGAG